MHCLRVVETGDRVTAPPKLMRRRTAMPEEDHRGDEARRPDETSEAARPEATPVPSVPPAIPPAPDSKRERQMTDFPDED